MSDHSPVIGRPGKKHQFSFSGSGKEYFGIWIVNLLLSIVTVGIYTAWAKVRRLRYFYGNTWLDGHNFEYHAKPVQILIGRIIAIFLLILLNVVAEILPLAALAFLIPYLLALPWFINKAFQFNSRMTSYRNVRFGFKGKYLTALWIFIVLPFIVPLIFIPVFVGYFAIAGMQFENFNTANIVVVSALGLSFVIAYIAVYPYISKKINEYIANNLSFGIAEFQAELPMKDLYRNLLFVAVPLLIVLGISIAFGVLGVTQFTTYTEELGVLSSVIAFLFYATAFASYFAYKAGVRNIAYKATTLAGQHQLDSELPRFGYAWVLISNLIISILTIGLAIPWAAVRAWRYIADYTFLQTHTDLESFAADQNEQGNVAAAEYLDIDGIDFGL